MKTIFKYIGILLLVFMVGTVSTMLKIKFFGADKKETKSNKIDIDAIISKMVRNTAKQLPMLIDSETELSSITYIQRQLQLQYRLVNHVASKVDKKAFLNEIRPIRVNSFCTDDDTKLLRNMKGGNVVYKYFGKNGSLVSTIKIDQSDCK